MNTNPSTPEISGVDSPQVAIVTQEFGRLLFSAHPSSNPSESEGTENVSIVIGKVEAESGVNPLVRIHSECITGDLFGSLRCDCGEQLRSSILMMQEEGGGILIYLRQEGRGIGLLNKLRAYKLQEQGLDTLDANQALGLPVDARDYSSAASILKDYYGITAIRLITNNPAKLRKLEELGILVSERIPTLGAVNQHNKEYLRAKAERLGHWI
jgi:3,4-dihydroxy 2-butanone 4-phosphate synthase/GTP cyclohydrolase II